MNKSSCKQHAYFKKFTGVSHSLCHSSCLDNDLNDIVHSRLYKNRALFRFTMQHCTDIHSNTCRFVHVSQYEAIWNGNDAGLQYMPHSTCKGFGVGNYATGCLMFMLPNMCTNEASSWTQINQHDISLFGYRRLTPSLLLRLGLKQSSLRRVIVSNFITTEVFLTGQQQDGHPIWTCSY